MNNGMNRMRGGWRWVIVSVLAIVAVHGCSDDTGGTGGGPDSKAIRVCRKQAHCGCEMAPADCEEWQVFKDRCPELAESQFGEAAEGVCKNEKRQVLNCVAAKTSLSCGEFLATLRGESLDCATEHAAWIQCAEEAERDAWEAIPNSVKVCTRIAECMCELIPEYCELPADPVPDCAAGLEEEYGGSGHEPCEIASAALLSCLAGTITLSCGDFLDALSRGDTDRCASERESYDNICGE